jgi:hypothetical protein
MRLRPLLIISTNPNQPMAGVRTRLINLSSYRTSGVLEQARTELCKGLLGFKKNGMDCQDSDSLLWLIRFKLSVWRVCSHRLDLATSDSCLAVPCPPLRVRSPHGTPCLCVLRTQYSLLVLLLLHIFPAVTHCFCRDQEREQ